MQTVEKVELGICCLVLFYFLSHGLHDIQGHSSQINKLKKHPVNVTQLSAGWKYVPRQKDGDEEWHAFCSIGLLEVVTGLSLYILVSGIISTKFRRFADYVEYDYFRLILALLVVSKIFDTYFTAAASIIALVFYVQSCLIRSNMFSLVLLVSSLMAVAYFPEYIEAGLPPSSTRRFLLVPMTVMLLFRCCSFCFEKGEYGNESFTDYANYIFYLPTFITGPIITYDQMQMGTNLNAHGNQNLANYTRVIKQLSLLIIKLALADYVLHYLYVFAVTDHIVGLSSPTTALLMSLIVIFDWTKCYFIYEIVRVLMEFDGFAGPEYPKSFFTLFTFADTYFDRSLHFWVSRYFYDPNCNKGFIRETIGAAITFLIVWLSQGAGWEIGIWAVLNFTGLQVESFLRQSVGDTFEQGPPRVFKFGLFGLNYLLILKANLVGIVGLDRAYKLSTILLQNEPLHLVSTVIITYCYASINIILQNNGYRKIKID